MENCRRSSQRFSIKQFVDLSSDGQDFLPVRAVDLSSGGLACESSTPLDPMMPVFIMLGFGEGGSERTVRLEGYVAHSRMDGGKCVVGISFSEVDPEAQAAIDGYLSSLSGAED